MPKNRQFALAPLTIPGCPPPELIYLAARAGYDAVSLRTIPMGMPGEPDYRLSTNKTLFRQVKAALSATGLHLNDVENARIYAGVDIGGYMPEVEALAELGLKHLLTNIWTEDRSFVVDRFAELCELGRSCGMSVNVEFVTWASVRNIAECLEIIAAAGCANAGIVVDTLHFNRSRCSLGDIKSTPTEYLRFAHICDAPGPIPATSEELVFTGREARLYPGEGSIDIAAIVRALPDLVYGLEIPNLAAINELGRAEHVFRALEATKNYFEANGL